MKQATSENLENLMALREFYNGRPAGAERFVAALDHAIEAVSFLDGVECPAATVHYDASVFGERLGYALADSNLTERDLAEKTGLTVMTISRYVRGTLEPKLSTIVTIANVTGWPIGWLLGIPGEKETET